MTSEGFVAAGYTAAGVLVAKLVDVAIRWRASTHITPDTELKAALEAGAKLREDYRKRAEELSTEAERLRVEREEMFQRIEAQDGEIRALQLRVEVAERTEEELRAEIIILRKALRGVRRHE